MQSRQVTEQSSRIVGVGTATPPTAYTQQDILDLFQVDDRRIRSLFMNSAIETRYLTLPITTPGSTPRVEGQGELLEKHKKNGVDIGARALVSCLESAGAGIDDIACLCCVTSTGFLTPGLSALLCDELDIPRDCARFDIVGMGCNAGLNGLNAAVNWSQGNRGSLAILLCVEVCSSTYVFDGSMKTAVVNSLFGDGAAAAALVTDGQVDGPTILKQSSLVVPEALDAMRFSWDDEHGKFSFFLDRDIPYLVGAHAEQVIEQLLDGTQLRRSDIDHWVVHSGGKKVIDSVRINLGLSEHDVRHTFSVLRDYGNLSSGSFLFSLERLLQEGGIDEGDYGVLMTMGPGLTIEMALVQW